jgi:hypothetical protein
MSHDDIGEWQVLTFLPDTVEEIVASSSFILHTKT